MAIKRYAVLVFFFVAALFLDTAVLPKWNLFDMVPFVMLALMLASEALRGPAVREHDRPHPGFVPAGGGGLC